MVRDAVDIAPFTIGHYLRLGFDSVQVIDDASSDGTYELLQAIAEREPRLVVERSPAEHFAQRALLSGVANRMIAAGISIVFPFDIDEFWDIDLDAIRRQARGFEAGLFRGALVQFVQHRSAGPMSASQMLRVKHCAPTFQPGPERRTKPIVCGSAPKVAFKAVGTVEFTFGQHKLSAGPTNTIAKGLAVDHLPYRNRAQMQARAARTDRILAVSRPGQGWHYAKIRDAVAEGRLDELWAANSANGRGYLTHGEKRIRLIRNGRMRAHLVKAWLYMVRRYPRAMLGRRPAALPPRGSSATRHPAVPGLE
jgi:hypothetical protein